jgi:hypothetical protein
MATRWEMVLGAQTAHQLTALAENIDILRY